jgi:hypothetical protein
MLSPYIGSATVEAAAVDGMVGRAAGGVAELCPAVAAGTGTGKSVPDSRIVSSASSTSGGSGGGPASLGGPISTSSLLPLISPPAPRSSRGICNNCIPESPMSGAGAAGGIADVDVDAPPSTNLWDSAPIIVSFKSNVIYVHLPMYPACTNFKYVFSVDAYPSGSHRAQSLPSTTPAFALRILSQDLAPIRGIFRDIPHRLELLRLLVDPPSDNVQRQPSVSVEAS